MKTLIRNTMILALGFSSCMLFAADDIAELEKAIAKRMSRVQVTRINTTPVSALPGHRRGKGGLHDEGRTVHD